MRPRASMRIVLVTTESPARQIRLALATRADDDPRKTFDREAPERKLALLGIEV